MKITSKPLDSNDPSYWMLMKGLEDSVSGKKGWISETTVYNSTCYICQDYEFALMGLPLCYPCPKCGAHTPADDTVCDNGHDSYEEDNDP